MTLLLMPFLFQAPADQVKIMVDPSKPAVRVERSLFGIFFEEINQAGEGGLYGELLRNRGLEVTGDGLPLGWTSSGDTGTVSVDRVERLNDARPCSLRIESTGPGMQVANTGFWGIGLDPKREYRLVLWTKGDVGYQASLRDADRVLASGSAPAGSSWHRTELTMRPSGQSSAARLVLSPAEKGTLWLGYASLMPVTSEPFRPDLKEKLAAMRPGFVRFPGGCFVEGDTLPIRWNWKDSLGSMEQRRGMPHSQWGYPISNGLGYHEYLQLCEDLGAEPLFVANVGMSHREVQPMEKMDAYVQDALDAIEYANGSTATKWGAERAKRGHPKPFGLKYVEIGNENGGAAYNDRFKLMSEAIHRTYPDIQRIADVWGGLPSSAPFELIDEHYYSSPAWFWRNSTRYDGYPRSGPRIYVGEYAVTQGCGRGNLAAALGEAAFMVGMERNADIVKHASYAPLFENVNNRQWNPNAILFDSTLSYGTPSYWVQVLFGQNRVDEVVSHTVSVPAPARPAIGGQVGLQTWRTAAEFKDISVLVDGKPVHTGPLALERSQGNWGIDAGTITQTSLQENRRTLLSGLRTGGSKIEVRLKARKKSGAEGFIIMFEVGSGRELQWNLGGWGNTVHAFQVDGARFGKGVPGEIDTDRWYDIRIEQERDRVRGYLDGRLIEEAEIETTPDFAALAGIDHGKNELVITAVNGAPEARTAMLNVAGLAPTVRAEVITLSGTSLDEENSFDTPLRIAPKSSKMNLDLRSGFRFSPYSVTILRIPR